MSKARIEIKSFNDLLEIMSDMFSDFLQSLEKKKGMKRKPNPDNDGSFAYEVSFMWTDKALILIGRYKERMKRLFAKYYPDNYFSIYSTYFIEA